MKLLDTYNETLESIYDYFGFKEDWAVFPIDDRRRFYWQIEDDEVTFHEGEECSPGDEYSDEILNHRLYPKSIYEGAEYTMIIVDTHTDGNKFLAIYDNSKRLR